DDHVCCGSQLGRFSINIAEAIAGIDTRRAFRYDDEIRDGLFELARLREGNDAVGDFTGVEPGHGGFQISELRIQIERRESHVLGCGSGRKIEKLCCLNSRPRMKSLRGKAAGSVWSAASAALATSRRNWLFAS